MIAAVWQAAKAMKADDSLDEPGVVVAMRQMSKVWEHLFPIEQHRILRLLNERVQLQNDGLEIIWREEGWHGLLHEFKDHSLVDEQRNATDNCDEMSDCEVLSGCRG